MSGIIKELNINKIINYFENPRHAVGKSEEDTLKKLFEAAGNQHMLNLALDIQANGLLGSQQIVVVFSDEINKYVVYEGNRRVAAIKLLLYPEKFTFLDKATLDRAKKIAQQGKVPNTLKCYVTDQADALFIMERIHSGEDKGRGVKQWTSREKEVFKVRRSREKKKNLSYLIDVYVKKHCNGLDITTIIPFTTIQRLFNNHDVRKQIGLDITREESFTPEKMNLIVAACKWVTAKAKSQGVAVTRLCNTAEAIEQILLPWIKEQMNLQGIVAGDTSEIVPTAQEQPEVTMEQNVSENERPASPETESQGRIGTDLSSSERVNTVSSTNSVRDTDDFSQTDIVGSGDNRNLPYFFQGLQYGALDPNDPNTHGVAQVCKEIQLFSEKKLVAIYPIASTFLVRALIEQTIIYYSKNHNIQGQNKLIWENIKDQSKLSKKIDNFKRNLPNYILDATMRQYFRQLFDNYETTVDPLNWVVHKPAEFQLDAQSLIDLPRKGLLSLINFMLS